MAANQPTAAKAVPVAPDATTGGAPVPGVSPTPVLGDSVHTEGAITNQGTVTSHSGPPTAPGVVRRDMPQAAPLPPVYVNVRNALRQPLHHSSGIVPAGGTFQCTEREFLAYGAQVVRV